jgi:methylthioribulose-1-phosphate dehydratase
MTARPTTPTPPLSEHAALIEVVRRLHARGWAPGTGGNFSVALPGDRLLMTPSGVDKGRITARQLVEIDRDGHVVAGDGAASAETRLHLQIVRSRGAGAVLHIHSVWNTILSLRHARAGALVIDGLEMLKGLAGVTTHEHRERVPVVANSQDMPALAADLERVLAAQPDCHGVLVAGHGLYTWGSSLAEAERHVEILEFLFEVLGRQYSGATQ